MRCTLERAIGGSIEAVGASRFDVCFGQANVAQIEVGQVTKPALYVAAGPPLIDEGQQAFERTSIWPRVRRRSVASNSKQHPELHKPNQDEKTYRQRSEQIYWDLGDVPRVVGPQFRLGIVLVDCLDFLEN